MVDYAIGREIDLRVGEENNQFTNHVDVSGKEAHLYDRKQISPPAKERSFLIRRANA